MARLTLSSGRVYAGWGFSQAFYRERLFESVLGFKDLEDFMKHFWEAWALSKRKLIIYSPHLPGMTADL